MKGLMGVPVRSKRRAMAASSASTAPHWQICRLALAAPRRAVTLSGSCFSTRRKQVEGVREPLPVQADGAQIEQRPHMVRFERERPG